MRAASIDLKVSPPKPIAWLKSHDWLLYFVKVNMLASHKIEATSVFSLNFLKTMKMPVELPNSAGNKIRKHQMDYILPKLNLRRWFELVHWIFCFDAALPLSSFFRSQQTLSYQQVNLIYTCLQIYMLTNLQSSYQITFVVLLLWLCPSNSRMFTSFHFARFLHQSLFCIIFTVVITKRVSPSKEHVSASS